MYPLPSHPKPLIVLEMRQNSQTNIFYCSTKYESQTIEVLIYFTKTFFQKYLFLEETYFYKNFADLAGGENDAFSVFDRG